MGKRKYSRWVAFVSIVIGVAAAWLFQYAAGDDLSFSLMDYCVGALLGLGIDWWNNRP